MLFTASSSQKEVWSIIKNHLHLGASDPKHPFHFVNLCTLDGDQPDSRYVVLREVNAALQLFIYTDSRSEKIAQINKNPNVSLLFYHAEERCQVKINGKANIVSNTEIHKEHWKSIQKDAQKGYQSILAPKTTVSRPEEGWEQKSDFQSKNFSVISILPDQIECLQLDRRGHLRIAFDKVKNNWIPAWLVP
ncbi:pyridoxamine 5'-phosphate oxidase family protein [Cyclobacterium qasimii]|uniref:Pyridoxamine 5'-phosphate oxidase Alr4036 family FMN-binding domain-containing protein n=1 Tax=Cyclobacterium qasimii TaxID=1350429 RepID=A0A512CA72_9BACT|nr:pyridoxamine 5'-phosphate oxidase family protein [Cyclobacterium qasimii]GEO21060.1 hypothetical protein CQA01_15940 [Cyclobacterium qasimii]